MNENIVKRNDLLAQKVIKGLQSRNMSGSYARDRQEALKLALDLIPEGIPTLKLCDPCDRVLLESTPSPAIPVCERTQDIPEHAEWVMAHALWYEEKDAWQDAVQAHPERIYLFPYSPESLAALVGLVPEKAVETV